MGLKLLKILSGEYLSIEEKADQRKEQYLLTEKTPWDPIKNKQTNNNLSHELDLLVILKKKCNNCSIIK